MKTEIKKHKFKGDFVMNKRVFSILLALAILLSALPMAVSADEQNGDISVSTSAELAAFAASVNGGNDYAGKTVVLKADINLGGENSPWTAIGNKSSKFKGTFDGNNHVVSGLYIAEGSNIGLFGYVDGGTVKNVTVRGSVSGSSNAAGIVGYLNAGKVENCGNNASVSGGSAVAGVVGYVGGASVISGCYNSGDIKGTTGYIGGVTGQHWQAGEVTDCYNSGTVTGPATVGGVTGGHKAASPVLTNCYNAGQVADSAGRSNNIGAVIGASRGTNTNCYYIKGTGSDTKSGITETETLSAAALGAAFKEDTDGLNGGRPVLKWQQKTPDLIIGTYGELKAFADSVNGGNTYEGKYIRLDVNVNLGGKSNAWTAIGNKSNKFKGTFDGNNHVVSGLYIAEGSYIGLFGYVDGGTVKNVTVRGSVSGSSNAAGIVGYLNAGKVENCGNNASVSGGSAVAGVVGYVGGASVISGCYNSGDIKGTTGYIGGVTGQHWQAGEVTDCYNSGTVTGPATVGGVTGGHKAASPVLTNCYNAGQVADSAGRSNNIGAVIGASRGTNTNCYYIKGTGSDSNSGVTETETLTAAALGAAFTDGAKLPRLVWESSVSSAEPVRPIFTERTELSAQLAGYIKAAVKSAKEKAGVAGTLLGNPDYMAGASSTATDWMALAMGRFGYFDSADGKYYYMIDDGTGYADYLAAMKAYNEKTYAANGGILHSAKATEWHRAVVSIKALGGDPTEFGTYNGAPINMIADGSYNNVLQGGPGKQGINGWIWGLISMDTGMYAVPADAKYPREVFIKEILKMQLTDGVNGNEYGGWVLGGYGTVSDVDISAMAIQALAPYYNDDTVYTYKNEISGKEVSKTVRRCVDEALDTLGSKLNSNAGFSSWNTNNVESISQVVVALCSLGINPNNDERFITPDGKTLLDGMLAYRVSNGGFCHILNGGWNSMANDQATYALVSYWRLENGMRALYDMRDNWTKAQTAAIKAAADAINALPEPGVSDYKARLKAALAVYRAVDETERRYVDNYSTLASAIALVGGEEALDSDAPYITSISVTKAPNKIRYYGGERFDKTGMVVTARYSDGSKKEITDYKVSETGELALTTDTVYIYYGILKTSVSVEVREKMPWDGEGTEDDPYIIKTPDDIVDLYRYVSVKKMVTAGVHFKLAADLNLKNINDWRGIADNVAAGFRGHFDGNGHSVWNMNGSTYNANGFFGKLGDGALIENLTIASGSLGGSYNTSIGGIAGSVAENSTVTVKNCHNYADMSGSFGIGGIVGFVDGGAFVNIENCSNHAVIKSSYTGGGIIGQVGENRRKDNGARAKIVNCYNTGKLAGMGSWGLGGIVGSFRTGGKTLENVIENCYNTGIVPELETAGAVFGSACETVLKLQNVHYLNSSNTKQGGVFTDDGSDEPGTVIGTAAAETETDMKADAFAGVLGGAFAKDADNINGGYPILTGQKATGGEAPVRAGLEISTADELKAFADRVNGGENFSGKTVMLTSHIDLGKFENWTPIGKSSKFQFDGMFDGQGYVIDNLYSKTGGLFGYVCKNAVIKNVSVASGEIGQSNLSFIGGIANWSNGADFINCRNGADIYASGYSGGIVGTVRDGGESTISACCNTGSIYGGRGGSIGGIVGHLATSSNGTAVNVLVTDCYNAGLVTTTGDTAGGIVGRAQDGHTVKNCYNAGKVTVTGTNILDGAGGIASLMTSDNTVENCYYDSSATEKGVSNGNFAAAAKTSEEMKSDEFPKLLGSAFKKDEYALVNNGYPLVYWQKTEDADSVNEVINKIAAIGTVTLQSADSVNSARNAYDNLDEPLKALVSNYAVLQSAEKALLEIQTLQQAKESAKSQLENYKRLADYRESQKKELEDIISEGSKAIEAAPTAEDAAKALAAYKARMDAVKTDKQLSEEENKTNNGANNSAGIPKTGDTSAMPLCASVMLISLLGIAYFSNKKRKTH